MIKKINFLFVTLFGIGKIKKIPGSIASLAPDANSLDISFERQTKKINSILNAAEGFWIPSEICKKYVPLSW